MADEGFSITTEPQDRGGVLHISGELDLLTAEKGRLLRSPHGDLPLGLLAPYLVECGHRHTRTDDSSFTSAPSIATTSTWNVSPAAVTVDSTARFASPSTIHTTNVTSAEPVAT